MYKPGDVVLAIVQFTDSAQTKQRPALVLFEELGNVVVAGITSNTKMQGIPLRKKDGAALDSVIKLNYIFTLSETAISRFLFHLPDEKKVQVYEGLEEKLSRLKGN
ncbi:type II toxin-antitoxin system PemK/MazF family toxin [Candidatus Parvarchaeota archaeon]|nr:type II toxin-antitoxin system PemK/MazF family toxin [Candidatus Parvarchaeota archaeon]